MHEIIMAHALVKYYLTDKVMEVQLFVCVCLLDLVGHCTMLSDIAYRQKIQETVSQTNKTWT